MAAFQLSGSLEEIPLPDIARLFQSTRKTGRLALVSGLSKGFLFFDHGDIVDCQASNMAGIDALKHLALFNRGSFEFHDGVAPASRSLKNEATTITTTELIEVLENRMMESRQLQELVPVGNEVPRYLGGALPSDLELGAADLLIAMKCAPGAQSVARLALDLSLDERMVSYTIARFRAAGLMEIVGVIDDVPEPPAETAPSSPPSTIAPPPRNTDPGSPASTTPSAGPRYWRGRKIEG